MKVTVKKLESVGGKGPSSIGLKVVTDSDGRKVRLRTLDADSAHFGDDLTRVFRANVRRARTANKLLAGS